MNPPKISIIIPAYNCEKSILSAVKSCLAQRYPAIEVIVVDDGSTDATAAIVAAVSGVALIRQENKGPACARNAGAQAATGEFLAFTDSDCVTHVDWLEKLMARFSNEKIGAVAGSYGITNAASVLARCVHAEIIYRHAKFKSEGIKVLGSYNFAIRKKLFDQLGGFDGSYRRASGEDNDLSYRIIKSDHGIAFAKEALVDHTHPDKVLKYWREQFRHGFWRAKLYFDHPRMAQGDDYTFWKDALETLASGLFLLWLLVAVFVPGVLKFLIVFAFFFFLFELVFCILLRLPLSEAFFYAWVMLARSLARLLGLATGILRFIFALPAKKS